MAVVPATNVTKRLLLPSYYDECIQEEAEAGLV